ncbi:uncharacterized protein LOC130625027 isoform X2 [Hydractinia symbiolongicarpus]|uniref:uncharacterized protein LOC130625027 isoform X2 n=1 Tax=Hydractinia symbiolongicarpus TaxID=13093 RepID=UPI00254E666C|nr:uncharacterized protein LOC130625027 isoform X2 [Hydractinia symbiolongicarpus]
MKFIYLNMKLRIKYNSTRTTIDVPDEGTLQDLLQQCQAICQVSEWFLSLNGKDEMTSSAGETLSSMGLVSGDLLHIVDNKMDDSLQLVAQLLQMGFQKNSAEKAVLTFGATNFNDAIELLNMLGESSLGGNQDQSSSQSHDDKQGTNEQKKEDIVRNFETAENMNAEKLKSESQLTTNKSRSKIPPLFLQDGITYSFRELVNRVECETEADYLCLAAHALILETGFQNKVTRTNKTYSADAENRRSTIALPSNWKNSEMGLYRLNYTHNTSRDMDCCVTASVTGKSVLITGTLDEEDVGVFQVKLKIAEYINSVEISAGHPEKIYTNLNKLSRKVKDSITTKILNEIRTKLGVNGNILSFTTLPQEVQLRLLCFLDVVSICRMSQVARELRVLCGDESIWRRVLQREFNTSNPVGTSYKQTVKHMYVMRREELLREEQRLRAPRTPLRPEFDVGPDLIYPNPSPRIPGMIGGRYDLYPSGGFHPGGFPNQPGLDPSSPFHPDILRDRQPNPSNARRPPGARYDLVGPMSPDDDDFHPGRRQHPDTLRRPRFGDDLGAGGGFGGFM